MKQTISMVISVFLRCNDLYTLEYMIYLGTISKTVTNTGQSSKVFFYTDIWWYLTTQYGVDLETPCVSSWFWLSLSLNSKADSCVRSCSYLQAREPWSSFSANVAGNGWKTNHLVILKMQFQSFNPLALVPGSGL